MLPPIKVFRVKTNKGRGGGGGGGWRCIVFANFRPAKNIPVRKRCLCNNPTPKTKITTFSTWILGKTWGCGVDLAETHLIFASVSLVSSVSMRKYSPRTENERKNAGRNNLVATLCILSSVQLQWLLIVFAVWSYFSVQISF